MKSAPFDYVRATSIDEACRLLESESDKEIKIIAGGQTLVPLMAMRMARPDVIIDINDISDLGGIEDCGDYISFGGCARQRLIETSSVVRSRTPLVAKAVSHVGHLQTRNRGTIGGSIVHGDPSAELPLVALVLDGTLVLRDVSGKEEVPINGFFESAMVTNIRPNQILTEVRIPVWSGGLIGAGFQEMASREGDFAIVAAAAQIQCDKNGRILRAAVAAGGVAPVPVRLFNVETGLLSKTKDDVEAAVGDFEEEIAPEMDVHATAEYRSRVVKRLVRRAIVEALMEANP